MEGKIIQNAVEREFLTQVLDKTNTQNKDLMAIINSQINAIKLKNLVKGDFTTFDKVVELYPVCLHYSRKKFSKNYQGFVNAMLKVNSKLALTYQSMKARCVNLNKIENKIALNKSQMQATAKNENKLAENIKIAGKPQKFAGLVYVFGEYNDILKEDLPNIYETFNANQDKYFDCVSSFQTTAKSIKENTKTNDLDKEASMIL